MLIPPSVTPPTPSSLGTSTTSVSSVIGQQQQTKTYALVLPSSTLTAPIGSKNNDRPRSGLLLPPIPPAATAALSAQQQQQQQQQQQHSPFYLYMSDVPRNRHYESLESLQHDRYTSEFAASLFYFFFFVFSSRPDCCVLCCVCVSALPHRLTGETLITTTATARKQQHYNNNHNSNRNIDLFLKGEGGEGDKEPLRDGPMACESPFLTADSFSNERVVSLYLSLPFFVICYFPLCPLFFLQEENSQFPFNTVMFA